MKRPLNYCPVIRIVIDIIIIIMAIFGFLWPKLVLRLGSRINEFNYSGIPHSSTKHVVLSWAMALIGCWSTCCLMA